MEIWIAVIGLLGTFISGGLIGAVGKILYDRGDLSLRRRVETIRVFLEVSGRAHGYRPDGTEVGPGERVAAIYLMADLASRDDWLRQAGERQLQEQLETIRRQHRETSHRESMAREALQHEAETDPDFSPDEQTPVLRAFQVARDAAQWHQRLMDAVVDALGRVKA